MVGGPTVPRQQSPQSEPTHAAGCVLFRNTAASRSGGVQAERAHKHTHTPEHPSQEWRGAAETRAQAHTPTPHTSARSGGVQAERAHKHTDTPQHPSQEWRGAAKTRAQAHKATPQTQARNGEVQAGRTHNHTRPKTPARNGGVQDKTQAQPHTPQTPARNGGTKPESVPKHTHPRPQPGLAGLPRNPDTNTSATQR